MDRKKILILIFALVLLVGGAFLITRRVSNKNQGLAPTPTLSPMDTEKKPANLFGQTTEEKANATDDISGTIDLIAEKTLTIKTPKDSALMNINGATPVMITDGKNQAVAGQMADLKVGDAVRVIYDKTTKNALLISVTKK